MSDSEANDAAPSGGLKSDANPTSGNHESDPEDAATLESPKVSPKKGTTAMAGRYTYKDYSQVAPPPSCPIAMSPSAIRVQKLPAKLNAMLSEPAYNHIISWMPHGRSWKVHNPQAFVEEVIPLFFEYTNYNSFVRLVNAWGFRRITKGSDRNSYYHELFLRGLPHLHSKMHRLTAKEKKVHVHPDDEPDFYKISALCPLPASSHSSAIVKPSVSLYPSLHSSLVHEQIMAKRGLGARMPSIGAYPTDLAASRLGAMNPLAAAQLEQEELAMATAGIGSSRASLLNPTLSRQRAELIAANEAYELQAAHLRERERRIAYLRGASGPGLDRLAYPGASLGRFGRGVGMLPADMLGDPAVAGLSYPMPPSVTSRVREPQESKEGPDSGRG